MEKSSWNIVEVQEESEIKTFYKDATVLLLGGTGFLGKLLLEKLLREIGNLEAVYVGIRKKDGKNVGVRMEEMLRSPVIIWQNTD